MQLKFLKKSRINIKPKTLVISSAIPISTKATMSTNASRSQKISDGLSNFYFYD